MGSSSTSKTIVDLPSDLLLPILSRLELKDLQSLSLVSKPFLELSNRFVRKLSFKTLPDDRSFTQIFTRFTSVSQINLRTEGVGVARALTTISKSQLNLEALKIRFWPTYPEQISLSGKLNIKSLAFCFFSKVQADQVVEFIGLFPSLEELHFGTTRELDDAHIESLALKVPNLIKINLSGNSHLTDRALYALSANCVNLEHIGLEGLYNFTPQGFCTFLLRCQKLRYLDFRHFTKFPASNMLVAETVSACENLQHLSINYSMMRDATLRIIATSPASLKSLKMEPFLWPNIAYTMTGLSAMLRAFQGLTRLDICLPRPESDEFLDQKMSQLVKSLPCLTSISITSYCPIYATLFSLIENCPLMECISLNSMNVSGRERRCKVHVPRLIRKNYSVKYIHLLPSPDASFKTALSSFCPCLKNWDGIFPPEVFFPKNSAVYWT